jgi:hypothetical protein
MFFVGRIKRQQAMAQVTDPLIHKSSLMITALLTKRLGEETKFPNETLWFSMWLIYLAFSTAKPNSSKKERQSLNDAYNQVFTNLGMDAYETSDLKNKTNVTAYSTIYARDLMNFFITRHHEYDDAFNMDKGTAFAVSDEDFGDYVPANLLSLSIRNIYGPEYAISDPSSLDRDFVHGFMDYFTSTLSEAAGSFETFSL